MITGNTSALALASLVVLALASGGCELDDNADDATRDAGAPPAPDDAGSVDAGSADAGIGDPPPDGGTADVLHADGRFLLDTCGRRFVARGMEQNVASVFSADGTLLGLVGELAATGSNAVRILPDIGSTTVAELDAMLAAFAAERIVVYISPGDRAWFLRDDVRAMLQSHEKGIIIDAFQEPDFWDVPRWVDDAQAAIATIRGAGYRCPLMVLANGYGRDLPSALARGQEVVDADPLHNAMVGWQAYWGNSGWYQGEYGMSLTEGVEACAAGTFPVQVGIDLEADPGDVMDYRAVMAAAEASDIGWLWWDWWNPYGTPVNNASTDGTVEHLSAAGAAVIDSDASSIRNTAEKACFQ